MNKKPSGWQAVLHLFLMVMLVLMLFPLAMTLWNAFKSELGFRYTRWYPTFPLRYRNAVTAFPLIWGYIVNTVIVAVFGTAGMLFVSSLAAFSFSRIQFPGRDFLFMLVIALMMIPGIMSLVPQFMLYKRFGLLNTKLVLILPIITGGSVFGTFLLRAFFSGIPEDIFEAARIDGARDFKVYYAICLPLCMPIMGTLTIMQINGIWNDYLWPMITQQRRENLTISAGLIVQFVTQYSSNYSVQFAGFVLSSLPLVLLFIFANKYYIEGLTSSAIKL